MGESPLPDAALDDRLGFLGTAGSGKTYNSSAAVERLIESGARVVVVDPLDVWWGLRLSADGTKQGFAMPIFGGEHGDLPINERAGKLIGETVATMGESCIVSLGGFTTKESERRFMLDFLESLYRKAFGFQRPSNEQVAFIAGYSPNSTGYTNPRGGLKSAGLVDYPAPGMVGLTDAGRTLANAVESVPSGEELRRRVLAKLPGPQQRILSVAIEAHPEALTNEECATKAGYSASSTGYTNPRGALRTLDAISYPQPGQVRASDWLFP